MTIEQQEKTFDDITSKMKDILLRKGNDYSASTDRLSNFKLAGTICGLSPEQNCLSLIATKVARLGVLLSTGNKPNNESIEDSILDLCNYSILLQMLRVESKKIDSSVFEKYLRNDFPTQITPLV